MERSASLHLEENYMHMRYDKLVRDNIPEIIRKNGDTPVTHIAADEEYGKKLVAKLKEEAGEFAADDNAEELADLLEVIYAICAYKKVSREELESIRQKKADERGGFGRRIILEETK
jgi:predicted house-cleaning noncanonical NTP pyrophosphatase (MazG superfamily)